MLLPNSETPQEWTVVNTADTIQKMVHKICLKAPGPVVICYEAGVCGFALQRQIQTERVVCRVIAPSMVPVKPGERIKTDRRDARKLVFYLRAGMLTEVHPPDEQAESARDLVRCREAAQADLLRSRHRLLKFLLRRGMRYCDGHHWTQKHFRWLSGLRFEQPIDGAVFNGYLSEILHRKDRVGELTAAIAALSAQAPYAKPVGWLRCFRGIDTVTAMTIVTELYSFERFVSPRQLMSYLGLVPSEHSSDNSRDKNRDKGKGGITKTGNRRVRRVLIEAAWHQRRRLGVSAVLKARRVGQPAWAIQLADHAMRRLHQRYWHLVDRRGKLPTVAATAVARELVGFIWAALYLQDQAPVHFRQRQVRKKSKAADGQGAAEFLATV
jgi:transposase